MLDIQNILKIKCNAELSMFLSRSVPWNPSLKLPVYLGQKKLLLYVNILRTTLGENVDFQQFFSLIKFREKEFQSRRRKKKIFFWRMCCPVDTEQGLLMTSENLCFSKLPPASSFMLPETLGYSLDPGETELAWTTWKLKLQTHFCEHRLGKSILTGCFNCWSFNIMLNEEYFKK